MTDPVDARPAGAPPVEDPDRPLVERARAGDYEAFETLVARHERRVHALALGMVRQIEDAQDVTQDAFISAMEHLGSFRFESTFRGWLLAIATNKALHLIRKRKGLVTVPLEREDDESTAGAPLPDYIAPWRDDPGQLADRADTRRLLDAALAELDEKYRVIFLLRDVEGLSTREAAAAAGITESNAKVRLLRARLLLRERLTQTLGDPARRVERPHHHPPEKTGVTR